MSDISSSKLIIPKPAFDSCDETSLKLKWGPFDTSIVIKSIRLQYKEVHESWSVARDISVSNSGSILVNELFEAFLQQLTCHKIRAKRHNTNRGRCGGFEARYSLLCKISC